MPNMLDDIRAKIARHKPGATANSIAIIIKTINRKRLLMRAISSIIDHADVPFRFYIGDDGNIDVEQNSLYALLREAGHFVNIYDRSVSLTTALNDLARATQDEKFILRMDDDFAFSTDTRVSVLRGLLELVPAIGAISGVERQFRFGKTKIKSNQGFLVQVGRTLYRLDIAPDQLHCTNFGAHRLAIVGHARNFLLIRKDVTLRVPWNENLIFEGEHLDFFLRLARAGFLVGFTPDCVHEHHDDGIPTGDYTGRDRGPAEEARRRVFSEEHGVDDIRNVNFPESRRSAKRIRRVVDSLTRRLRP